MTRRRGTLGEEAACAFIVPVDVLRSLSAVLKAIHASAQVVPSVEHDDLLHSHASAVCNAPDFFESGGVELLEGG